jgi:hypothetical protein
MHSTNPPLLSCETTIRFLNNKLLLGLGASRGGAAPYFIILKQTTLFIETATASESRPKIFEKTTYMEEVLRT